VISLPVVKKVKKKGARKMGGVFILSKTKFYQV